MLLHEKDLKAVSDLSVDWNYDFWKRRVYNHNRQAIRQGLPGILTPELVIAVFTKHNWMCVGCGSDKQLTIDHKIPMVLRGDNTENNIQPMCPQCNSCKNSKPYIVSWQHCKLY